MVPSTRKISASGGTITKMTCSAITDSSFSWKNQLTSAIVKAMAIVIDMVRITKSAPPFTLVVRI